MELINKMNYNINEDNVIELSRNLNEPQWLLDLRLDALKRFNNTPLPSLRYSISVTTDVSRIRLDEINILNQINDGIKFDNKNIIALSFADALKNDKYNELIKKYFMSSKPRRTNTNSSNINPVPIPNKYRSNLCSSSFLEKNLDIAAIRTRTTP